MSHSGGILQCCAIRRVALRRTRGNPRPPSSKAAPIKASCRGGPASARTKPGRGVAEEDDGTWPGCAPVFRSLPRGKPFVGEIGFDASSPGFRPQELALVYDVLPDPAFAGIAPDHETAGRVEIPDHVPPRAAQEGFRGREGKLELFRGLSDGEAEGLDQSEDSALVNGQALDHGGKTGIPDLSDALVDLGELGRERARRPGFRARPPPFRGRPAPRSTGEAPRGSPLFLEEKVDADAPGPREETRSSLSWPRFSQATRTLSCARSCARSRSLVSRKAIENRYSATSTRRRPKSASIAASRGMDTFYYSS